MTETGSESRMRRGTRSPVDAAVRDEAAQRTQSMYLSPDDEWAKSLGTLSGETGCTLVGVTRMMYPHDGLGDEYYAKVVEGLDAQAGDDSDLAQLLEDGVDDLQSNGWGDKDEDARLDALVEIESTPFFQTVRNEVVTGLYGNPDVWEYFGYEGPSIAKGGYKDRGFNDIGWL